MEREQGMHRVCAVIVAALLVAAPTWFGASAQKLKPEDFLPEMNQPVEPVHIIGNIYYVGTNGVSSFLIVTSAGHILLDSAFNQSVPLIRDSIGRLGFRFEDIRVLLSTHAHFDHVAGHALIQAQTGAQVIASGPDAEIIRRGGEELWEGWRGSRVDRIIRDGDVVRLGEVELRAHLTPGHTEGCTTWTMDTVDAGQRYRVVFIGGYGINPGVRLVGNRAYPHIADDYARTFRVLKALKPDVFLAQHPEIFAFEEKVRKLRGRPKQNPFIDPTGYRQRVQEGEDAYREQLRRERGRPDEPAFIRRLDGTTITTVTAESFARDTLAAARVSGAHIAVPASHAEAGQGRRGTIVGDLSY